VTAASWRLTADLLRTSVGGIPGAVSLTRRLVGEIEALERIRAAQFVEAMEAMRLANRLLQAMRVELAEMKASLRAAPKERDRNHW
jgi:hypothetical protein